MEHRSCKEVMLRLTCALLVVSTLMLVSPQDVRAHDISVHHWMLRKAVDYLAKAEPELASKFPLDTYLPWLEYGARYADYTFEDGGRLCTWDYVFGKVSDDCDTIHHYGSLEDIESNGGVDVAQGGQFAAPEYAAALYNVAVQFWPATDTKPDLLRLERKHAGTLELGIDTDLGFTYLGGIPFCEKTYGRSSCPQWPGFVGTSRSMRFPEKSNVVSLKYLGWSIHLLEDMSVPHHARNDATKGHSDYESAVAREVSSGRYNHLPVNPNTGARYKYSTSGVVSNQFPRWVDRCPEEWLDCGQDWWDPSISSRAIALRDEARRSMDTERLLDHGIKQVAGLLASFFRSLPEGQVPISGVRYYVLQHKYSGNYVVAQKTDWSEQPDWWWLIQGEPPLFDLPGNWLARLYAPVKSYSVNNFQFELISAGAGYFYLRNRATSEYLCTGSRNNGDIVHYWGPQIPAGHEDRYRFLLVSTANGYYYLLHKYSGKYIGTGARANGANLVLWGPIPSGHEDRFKFRFEISE